MAKTRDPKSGKFSKAQTVGESTMGDHDRPLLSVAGLSGLRQYSGILDEEWHPKLRGRQADRVYTEMAANCPMIGAALFSMEMLIRQCTWRFDPSDTSDPESVWLADWFDGARLDMASTWDQFLSDALSQMTFGWSLFEILYKLRKGDSIDPIFQSKHNDGFWGWRDFAIRSQDSRDSWKFDDEGATLGMHQRVITDSSLRFIPMEKCLLFRVRSHKQSPEGRSLLRSAYRSYYYMTREMEYEAIGIERNLAGLPIAKIPWQCMTAGATADEAALFTAAKKIVQHARQDTLSGLVWPGAFDREGKQTGFDFELMSASGKNVADADVIIKRHRADIMVSLLAEVLLLGQSGTGSWALASEQTNLMSMALNAILKGIAETIQNKAVVDLARLNGFNLDKLPTLAYSDVEKQDALKLSQSLATLVQSGIIVPDDELEAWTRTETGLPPRDLESGGDRRVAGVYAGMPPEEVAATVGAEVEAEAEAEEVPEP